MRHASMLVIGLIAVAATAGAQGDTVLSRYRLRILGVYDANSGQPVEGADVLDALNGVSARTTSTGTVALAFLPEGGGFVRVKKIGYEMQTMFVAIAPTDTLPITVVLKRVAELPEVKVIDSAPKYVAPALRGFEDRRRNAAAGQFIPEAVIRKEEDRNVGSFLRAHLAGAVLADGRSGAVYILRSPRCGSGGSPAVYVDGVLLSGENGRGSPVNLANFPLTDLAAVEYYANTATAPAEFSRTLGSCGALLLWTRER